MNKKVTKKPELMAPAGDWATLLTAVQHGADAVYFGVDKLNMRAKAKNFELADLKKIVKICSDKNVKTYLTLNTIIYENEIKDLEKIVKSAKKAGVDMVICWDNSVITMCKKYDMKFCVSTQASISNSTSAEFYKSVGASRVVLARECSLKQIKEIKKKVDIEVEVFVHGAMCISVSGRCFLSHHLFGKSANRGECIQPCRRDFIAKEYEVYDKSIDQSLIVGEDYILSPKDLCSIEFIDKIIEAGADSLKIEGRKRSPEYVAKVVSVYRKAIDLYFDKQLTDEKKTQLYEELQKVYNRDFSSGFYFDKPSGDDYASFYGSKATTKKAYIGKVTNFFKKSGIAEIRIETGTLKPGDNLLVIGKEMGTVELYAEKIMLNEAFVTKVTKGDLITIPSNTELKRNSDVYKVITITE